MPRCRGGLGAAARRALCGLALAVLGCSASPVTSITGSSSPDSAGARAAGSGGGADVASPAAERPLPPSGLELRYAVDAARPATGFDLLLPAQGDAELLLHEPLGEKRRTPLGRFRGPLAVETRRNLERIVRERRLLDEPAAERVNAEGAGSIVLSTPEKRTVLGLVSSSAGLAELRAALEPILGELTRSPVAAVDLAVRGEPGPGGLTPVVELVHVGREPLPIVLLEGELRGSVLATMRAAGGSAREVALGSLDLRQLAQAGKLRSGIFALGPGERIALPLGATVPAGARVSARVSFWFPGPGRARQPVTLDAEAELGAAGP